MFKLEPPSAAGGAWTETVLYSFTGGSDGGSPLGSLLMDASGALYGTTEGGDDASCPGCGVVFKLTPPTTAGGAWTESVLHTFTGGSDGASPEAGLIFGTDGALYGTTVGNAVFKLTPPSTAGGAWTETVLYRFTGGSHGASPLGSLLMDALGALYGTTVAGGGDTSCPGCGVVFKLTPPTTAGGAWTETVLHSFTGSDGHEPVAGLISDPSGTLYGTTFLGGSFRNGTVFKLVTFAGTPGTANCFGQSVAALITQYGGLNAAAPL